jgi:hypothetical protein
MSKNGAASEPSLEAWLQMPMMVERQDVGSSSAVYMLMVAAAAGAQHVRQQRKHVSTLPEGCWQRSCVTQHRARTTKHMCTTVYKAATFAVAC